MLCLTSKYCYVVEDRQANLVEQLHGLGSEAGMKDSGLHTSLPSIRLEAPSRKNVRRIPTNLPTKALQDRKKTQNVRQHPIATAYDVAGILDYIYLACEWSGTNFVSRVS
jgi:hypothetical protein